MKILFVCSGNTCRSVMAEALAKKALRARGKDRENQVMSAGTFALPNDGASANAIEAMKEVQIDVGDHKAVFLTCKLVQEADLILTMTRSHKQQVAMLEPGSIGKTFTLAEFAGKGSDIIDPFGRSLDLYRQCAAELRYLIGIALDRLAI
ncbi:MAG TPA: low molecular weight protein arginine phosphatase [Desulfotomaculum sp.]|nr:low molecular weight protein arginine phosphatase [Desulfotomaculum sp.]